MQFSSAISYCCVLYPDIFHFPQCPVLKYSQPALNVKDKISHMQKRQSNPITGLDRPWGLLAVEATRSRDSWHMKVVWLSALCASHLYPP